MIRARSGCWSWRARARSPVSMSPPSRTLSGAVDAVYGRHITINATGAIAAVLGDCGVPAEIARGFALIARCAGLVGHLYEEHQKPAMRAIWDAAERAVPYEAMKE